jgi:hypothetical protein
MLIIKFNSFIYVLDNSQKRIIIIIIIIIINCVGHKSR